VREYNQSYNFFSGMNADAVARYQKDALTGHRPTWKMGANGTKGKGKTAEADLEGAADPFSMFSELNGRGRWRPGPGSGAEAKVETRKVFNAERKALQVMGLGPEATLEVVKAKYKALVKQHHPDANGGDRSTEDRLIEIIKAYNYLKTVVRGAG
jgi:curved DNA-binding protein CbpA